MINIEVDEAYAFDYLTILYIKSEKHNFFGQPFNNWKKCYDFLKIQVNNDDLWNNIMHSQEFKNIETANLKTFHAVEKAKSNEVTAEYVDKCNYERYIAKKEFQNKFFPNKITETKIGYEIYDSKN